MFKRFFLYFIVPLFLTSCAIFNNHRKQKQTPAWEADFNQSNHFDTTQWSKIPRGGSDWNRHMSDFDSLYAIRDGKLILRGIVNHSVPDDTARWITGGVYTKGKKAFGFGRLEIRAKFQDAQGAWPAFWMLAENMHWPAGGEIDIMERLNSDSIVYQTVHTNYTLKLKIKNNPLSHTTAPINPGQFNTYALEKYPDSLVFFVNGKRTFTYPRIKTDKAGQFPFSEHKHYLLIDMQLGGNWVGKVNPDDLPVEMEIDWVKFYKFE